MDFRDLLPVQGLNYLKKKVCWGLLWYDIFIWWWVLKQTKDSSRLCGSRPLHGISKELQHAIRSDVENQLLRVEHSSACRECWIETSRVQIITQVCLCWKLAAPASDKWHKPGNTHVQVCQMCKSVERGNSGKLQKSRIPGSVPPLRTQNCSITVTRASVNNLTQSQPLCQIAFCYHMSKDTEPPLDFRLMCAVCEGEKKITWLKWAWKQL